jgi:hypothetical protein
MKGHVTIITKDQVMPGDDYGFSLFQFSENLNEPLNRTHIKIGGGHIHYQDLRIAKIKTTRPPFSMNPTFILDTLLHCLLPHIQGLFISNHLTSKALGEFLGIYPSFEGNESRCHIGDDTALVNIEALLSIDRFMTD